MNDRILLIPEIAAMTRKPVDTIRWFRHRQTAGYDEGPRMFKLGRNVVAMESDVIAYIEGSRSAAGPAA
jgi:predicted DNA-binding transcriptional regulator AlpA